MIEVKEATGSKLLGQFIDFPHDLYKNDPNYVPELFIAQRDILTPGKHPFHKHSQLQPFLAYKDGKIVGRIAAILNNNHNAFNQVKEGFFGFFDSVNDPEVSKALFERVDQWLLDKGMEKVVGPANPTTNDTCGMLLEGFDSAPVAMMTYNAPYYITLTEKAGFSKLTDLIAWEMYMDTMDHRAVRMIDTLTARLNRSGITFRIVNVKKFKDEVKLLRDVYNRAWDKNLGFVPSTPEEFEYLANDLKLILDDQLCIIAEKDGQAIGFALGVPDINKVLIKVKRGRLFPTGIFKLLFGRKSIKSVRVITLGVVEGYRKMGIESVLYGMLVKNARDKGVVKGEGSWILEDNFMMNKALENVGGKPYKRYRLFQKTL
ncbi:MAG: hypothetical protein V4543_16675 [Bacteroidota bacterium]